MYEFKYHRPATVRQAANLLVKNEDAKLIAGGYTLVLNSATTEVVVYSDPQTDITDAVLTQLNAGAPIDLTKPAGGVPFNISTNLP